MKVSLEFIEAIRDANWERAKAELLDMEGKPVSQMSIKEIAHWLIDINAPSQMLISMLTFCAANEKRELQEIYLLEECMNVTTSKSNAFETFSSLLEWGLNPNVHTDGRGMTLLQLAIYDNRVRHVEALIKYGVDPSLRSIFGEESTNAFQDAATENNEAGELLLKHFQKTANN